MNESLANLFGQLVQPARSKMPAHRHEVHFAFSGLWNKIVITFLGQAPRPTPGRSCLSVEERIAHAARDITEKLFVSYLMRTAGLIEANDTATRHDLDSAQLWAVVKWLRMGRHCGSPSCVRMRQQERRWQVVEWLNDHYLDIWVEVEKKVPDAALRAQQREIE